MLFRQFAFGSAEYARSLALRERVLRTPLGKTLSDEDRRGEEEQLHFGIFDSDELVACLVVRKLERDSYAKLRQMAVAESRQGSGLGRTLVAAVEEALRERGFRVIELSARLGATGFYRKLGYTEEGTPYLEQGIGHIKMRKAL